MTFLTPLWSATTDAYFRKDYDWITNMFSKLNKMWLGLVFLGLIMLFLSPFAYRLWLNDTITPDFLLLSILLLNILLHQVDVVIHDMFANMTRKLCG